MILFSIKAVRGEQAFVTLHGRLVLGRETTTFRKVIGGIIESQYRAIGLDLGGLTKIDCAGLGELVRCYRLGQQRGVDVALLNTTRRLRHLLVITRLNSVLHEYAVPRTFCAAGTVGSALALQ